MNTPKNSVIYKKALTFLLVMSLLISALPVHGEGETAITEVQDEQEIVQCTYDDFVNDVNGYVEELKKLTKSAKSFVSGFYEVYANLNYREFAGVRKELANDNLIANNNWYSSYGPSYLFMYFVMDYNIDVLDKKKYDSAIDISKYIRDESIKELAHRTYEKFIEVYQAGTIECESFHDLLELMKELKTKNFEAYYYFFIGMDYLCKHCVLVNYPKSRISKNYKYESKNKLVLADVTMEDYDRIFYPTGPLDMYDQILLMVLDEYSVMKSEEYENFYKQMIQEIYTSTLE